MKSEYGSHDLAPKDSGTKDVGPRKIDFGEGTAKATPAPSNPACKRADSEGCYSEYANRNSDSKTPLSQPSVYNTGALAMDISAKDNGGANGDPPSPQGGM